MKRFVVCIAVLALIVLPFAVPTTSDARMAKSGGAADSRFIMHAAEDNLAEVQLGKLAQERASSDDVKKFGERMATDHQKAYDEIKQIADSKSVTVPSDLTGRAKKDYDRLSKLSGAAFDRAYMKMMVRDHNKDVKAFERESSRAKDADVRDWASKTLPTLKDHQQLAKDVASHVQTARGKSKSSSPSASPATGSKSNKY
jgi:putative membrane protein